MTDINIISQNIFKDDLHQYTFYITPGLKNDSDINILKKNNYKIYKYQNGLLYEYLLIKFGKYKMLQVSNDKKHIDLIYRIDVSSMMSYIKPEKLPYGTTSMLSNLLMNSEILGNKQKLYFEILKYNPEICKKYFAKTHLLKNINSINGVYIIRSFEKYSRAGRDFYVIDTTEKLNELKKKININDFIITEYIMNPLLFKKRKFHLRVLFMIKYINNNITFSIFKHIRINQAKLPYKK